MLKVVGASWHKTKVGSLIILGSLLLAVGALFILNIERPNVESVYCATAYYTPSTGYRVEFWGQGRRMEEIPLGVSRICYKLPSTEMEPVEWPHMELETSPAYPDNVQAFSAGLLEGSLLWNSIYLQWMENVVTPCSADDKSAKFCEWLRDTLLVNYNSVKAQIDDRLTGHLDSYWYQIHLFYLQLEGIVFGWKYGLNRSPMKRSGLEIPTSDFLILNLGADLQLIEDYYNRVVLKDASSEELVHFAVRQKQDIRLDLEIAADSVHLSLDHLLHDYVKAPYRVLKKYKLNYRPTKTSPSTAIVPGHEIVLTSSSGVLSSPDEFYAITGRHSRITVAGIDMQLEAKSPSLDAEILEKGVFLPARVLAANRLATSGRAWTKFMKRDPHSAKQWMLVDRRVLLSESSLVPRSSLNEIEEVPNNDQIKISETKPSLDGLVWVVDIIPGRLHGEDVTDKVLDLKKALHLEGTPHFSETLGEASLELKPTGDEVEPQIQFLKQEDSKEKPNFRHSVRFFASAPSLRSEYVEGMTVIHDGNTIEQTEPKQYR